MVVSAVREATIDFCACDAEIVEDSIGLGFGEEVFLPLPEAVRV